MEKKTEKKVEKVEKVEKKRTIKSVRFVRAIPLMGGKVFSSISMKQYEAVSSEMVIVLEQLGIEISTNRGTWFVPMTNVIHIELE